MQIRIPSGVLGDRPMLTLNAGTGMSITGTDDTNLEQTSLTFSAAGGTATNDFGPEGMGLLTWTYDIHMANNGGTTFNTGQLQLFKALVPKQVTLNNVIFDVTNAGVSLTSGQNFAGVYNSAGTKLAETADQTTNWGSTGIKTMALTTNPTIGGNAGDFVWIVALSNGGTSVGLARSTAVSAAFSNLNLTAATSRYGSILSGQTSLPASFTPASITQTAQPMWAAIS